MSSSLKLIGNIRKVLIYPHPILKTPCLPVENIQSTTTQQCIADLIATVKHANGLGLSAPQIGESQRIFVVRTPIATTEQQMKRLTKSTREFFATQPPTFTIIINPTILSKDNDDPSSNNTNNNTKIKSNRFISNRKRNASAAAVSSPTSTSTAVGFEACLSLPDYPALVRRYTGINVRYSNEKGEIIENQRLENLPAIVFQHEYDHLDGILINDRAISPETASATYAAQSAATNSFLSRASYDDALDYAMRKFSIGLIKYYNDNGELDRSEIQNGKDTVVHLDDDIKS